MYVYTEQREKLFTDEGQRMFLMVRDKAKAFLKSSGAFRVSEMCIITGITDCWTVIASIDRLVELGEIWEVLQRDVVSQDRIFTATGKGE